MTDKSKFMTSQDVNKAVALVHEKRFEEAKAILEVYRKKSMYADEDQRMPFYEDPGVYYIQGLIAYEEGDLEQAYSHLKYCTEKQDAMSGEFGEAMEMAFLKVKDERRALNGGVDPKEKKDCCCGNLCSACKEDCVDNICFGWIKCCF